MKTILEAKKDTAQLWGYPKPKNVKYRLMKYLLQCEVEDGLLFHNCVTRHLVLLSKEEMDFISQLPSLPAEPIYDLIANHFLVPEDFDEYKSINQLRSIYQKRYTGDAINHFVILPTTYCNAHCFYCYESDYPRVQMTEETAGKVIDYISEQRQDKEVLISWFGGEPLVGISRIDQISQGLKDRNIPFAADMVSNGYLFDQDVIEKSIRLWNLKRVQITLDGTEEVYNHVKAYANVKENPFQRVLRNIDLLSSNEIQVNIRLNIDFYNKDDIRLLIEDLGKRYSGKKFISVYLNMLFNNAGYIPVTHSQDERVELLKIIDDYTERIKDLKFGYERRKIPSLEYTQCMADNVHTVEIQPDGGLCRCEHENTLDSYGNIEEGIFDPHKLVIWREPIERSEHCPDCVLYPSCYLLRRCMNADIPCVESIRLSSQKNHIEQMQSIYYKSLEEKKDETICNS